MNEALTSLAGALEGLRVVDLSRLLPGPMAAMILGDLGAEVVKVESPRSPDGARMYQPFVGDMGAMFASFNRNKRSLAVDLRADEGREVLARLLATADVLVESFRPGVLAAMGFDPARLARDFPRLVVCAITGYGQTGPAAALGGHDVNYLARAGLLAATGTREGALAVPGFQAADVGGGTLYGVAGILAALWKRERTGRGTHLDISMTDGALSLGAIAYGNVAAGGPAPGPAGDLLNGGVPAYGVYRTRDGRHMALGALEPQFWARFCALTGFPPGAGHGVLLGEAGEALTRDLEALFATRTQAEWSALLFDEDACCVPVRRADEVEDDPLFRDREIFFALEHPALGRLRQMATPLTPTDRARFTPPPLLGEHSAAVLGELGYTPAEVAALAAGRTVKL